MARGGLRSDHDPFGAVPRTARRESFFTGPERLASVDDLDRWMARAEAGQSFVYCEAAALIQSPTSVRVNELAADDLVHPLRKRRAGGGWEFYIVRSSKSAGRVPSRIESVLLDSATDLIFRELKRAANLALPCPSDAELMRKAGLSTRDQAQWRVRKLIDAGLVGSVLAYEGGVPTRVITVAATKWAGAAAGKSTALPKKWAELQRAAQRDLQAKTAGGAR